MLTSMTQLSEGCQWPPAGEIERLKQYDLNKKLFRGRHDLVFGDWVRLLREDQMTILEIVINFPKRLSTLWADFVFGQPPTIKLKTKSQKPQDVLNKLLDENLFNDFYSGVIDQSRYGECILKVRYDNKAIVDVLPPGLWFPICSPANQKDFQYHVIAYTFMQEAPRVFNLGVKEIQYLLCEIHGRGVIYNRLFMIQDGRIKTEVDIKTIFPDMPQVIQTGVNDFLVIPVFNLVETDSPTGFDDYQDIDGLIQELETRISQISRILDKHADPGMFGPESALEQDIETGQWVFKAGGKYIPTGEGDVTPGYLTFDGKLDPSFKEIELLMELLYLISETSPAAFGQLKSGLAESGSALRRLLMAPLAKARRLQQRWDPAIKKAIKLALQLENNANSFGLKEEDLNISIAWGDPLPKDLMEEAQIMQIRTANKATISQKQAIKRIDNLTDEEAQAEVTEIAAEANLETPVLFKTNLNNPAQTNPTPADQ